MVSVTWALTHLPALLYIPRVVQPLPRFVLRGTLQRSTRSPQDLGTDRFQAGEGQETGDWRPQVMWQGLWVTASTGL